MEKIRKEYRHEDKLAHITQWLSSDKLPSVYSKEVGIAYTTFRHWLDKYHYKKERKQPSVTNHIENKSSFLAIQIQPSKAIADISNKPMMELVFSSGARLNFYQTVSVDYLQQLLALR
jgi:hypothetical protein